jgi:tetratricopeptide (TPR) repeat protein
MKGLYEEGIQANLEAVRIQPEFPIAHNNLAVGYLEMGDYPKAVSHCDKAREQGYDVAPELLEELAPHRR